MGITIGSIVKFKHSSSTKAVVLGFEKKENSRVIVGIKEGDIGHSASSGPEDYRYDHLGAEVLPKQEYCDFIRKLFPNKLWYASSHELEEISKMDIIFPKSTVLQMRDLYVLKLGTKVKRGPHWKWGNQGEGSAYGEVYAEISNPDEQMQKVEWKSRDGKVLHKNSYWYNKIEKDIIPLTAEELRELEYLKTKPAPIEYPPTHTEAKTLAIGTKVKRGPNWSYRDQDKGSVYGVVSLHPDYTMDGWLWVKWVDASGKVLHENSYVYNEFQKDVVPIQEETKYKKEDIMTSPQHPLLEEAKRRYRDGDILASAKTGELLVFYKNSLYLSESRKSVKCDGKFVCYKGKWAEYGVVPVGTTVQGSSIVFPKPTPLPPPPPPPPPKREESSQVVYEPPKMHTPQRSEADSWVKKTVPIYTPLVKSRNRPK